MTAIAALMVLPRPALAGPTGGAVVAGSAGISQAGNTTNINQSTNKAIIDWQGFSIGPQETVNFNQPSSSAATLNRVIGNETSVIEGALNANGQVFIVNSAGVLFTKGAQVNAGGLVASTLDISDANFMAGNYVFSGPSAASVVNQGAIHARDGGYVALLGKTVSNEGVISATLGTVAMASGSKITLNFEGDSLIDVTIDAGTLNALVENKNAIKADGGRVILTAKAADAVLSAQVNNSGVIQARTMAALTGGGSGASAARTGSIKLLASGGTTHVAGTLDASAPNGGKGGKIETSGDKVQIADGAIITTKAASGESGTWTLDPNGFNIGNGGNISGWQLSLMLDYSNITIDSTYGRGIDGNVNVFAPVVWQANTILTLNATNNININAPITATGASAGLALNYGGYAATGSVAAGHNYNVNAPVTLSGANATLSINGQAYTLIHSMAQLVAITPLLFDANGNPVYDPNTELQAYGPGGDGHYALAQNLDASGATYNGPIISTLTGTLAGLGHTINNLTINTTPNANGQYFDGAFIDQVGDGRGSTAVVRDIGLTNVNITGYYEAAGLVALNFGTIGNAYVTGKVTGSGPAEVGGLVGSNFGTILNSRVNVNVTATNAGLDVAAFVTFNGGIISNSSAQGSVTAAGVTIPDGGLNASDSIGGFTGVNFGTITNSSANVDVTTTDSSNVGGFVGNNLGSVANSTYSGNITASFTNPYIFQPGYGTGGFAGQNNGSLSNVSAQGNLLVTAGSQSGTFSVGGLVGENYGTVDSSFTGVNVTTSGNVFGVGGVTSYANDPGVTNTTFGGTVNGVGPGAGAAAAAAAQQAAQAAQTAAETAAAGARAANVIATTDTAMTAATPPSAAISTAGTKATAALAGPTVEDNVKIEEPAPAAGQSSGRGAGGSSEGRRARTEEQNAPSEEPRPRRHAAAATASRKARTGGGAGLGATIRSIDIDGQHYNLQDGAPKNGASGDKAQ